MSVSDKLETFKKVIAVVDKVIDFLIKVVDYVLNLFQEQKSV